MNLGQYIDASNLLNQGPDPEGAKWLESERGRRDRSTEGKNGQRPTHCGATVDRIQRLEVRSRSPCRSQSQCWVCIVESVKSPAGSLRGAGG
jgi:hypothetical protein